MTKKKRIRIIADHSEKDPAIVLALATRPLLELFAAVDDVFTEDNALGPENRQKSLGRIYRAWKAAREQLDPDFNSKRDTRAKKHGAKVGTRIRATSESHTVVCGDDGHVLRSRRGRQD